MSSRISEGQASWCDSVGPVLTPRPSAGGAGLRPHLDAPPEAGPGGWQNSSPRRRRARLHCRASKGRQGPDPLEKGLPEGHVHQATPPGLRQRLLMRDLDDLC